MIHPTHCHWHHVCALATKQKGKPSVYISNGLEFLTEEDEDIWKFIQSEIRKLYEIPDDPLHRNYPIQYFNILNDILTGGLFFFENQEDQYRFYRIFEQPLTDSSAIYACTYSASGECETENT